ncbi:MAG: hypothetical protein AAFQ82_17980 [Myxococcota bacterium]
MGRLIITIAGIVMVGCAPYVAAVGPVAGCVADGCVSHAELAPPSYDVELLGFELYDYASPDPSSWADPNTPDSYDAFFCE